MSKALWILNRVHLKLNRTCFVFRDEAISDNKVFLISLEIGQQDRLFFWIPFLQKYFFKFIFERKMTTVYLKKVFFNLYFSRDFAKAPHPLPLGKLRTSESKSNITQNGLNSLRFWLSFNNVHLWFRNTKKCSTNFFFDINYNLKEWSLFLEENLKKGN